MEFPKLLEASGIAAVVAGIAMGWNYVKGFSRYITGIVLLQKTCDSVLATAVKHHLRQHYKKLPSGVSSIQYIRAQVGKFQHQTVVPFDMPNDTSVWFGARGVFVCSCSGSKITLISLRKFSDPYQLINDSLDGYDLRISSYLEGSHNFYVRQIMGSVGNLELMPQKAPTLSSSSLSRDTTDSDAMNGHEPYRGIDISFRYTKDMYLKNESNLHPLRGLFYPPEVIQVLEDMKTWYSRRKWYEDRGIPWRTGVLLHGPGGTGKSSFSKAVAQTLGLPLYQYCLNTLTDRDFVSEWGNMELPCVVALEDFDTVFHGRESTTVHKSLSFECVLNQISGISALSGILLIVTTNNMHHIDAALGQLDESGRPTRPGRIDRIVYMGTTTEEQRREIASYTLGNENAALVDMLVEDGHATTAAQFQSMCIEHALKQLADSSKDPLRGADGKLHAWVDTGADDLAPEGWDHNKQRVVRSK